MLPDRSIPAGHVKQIHVNVNSIRSNAKADAPEKLPVARVQCGREAVYGDRVDIKGDSTLVYRPDDPLPCGAKVWIETTAAVVISGVRTWKEKSCPVP